MVLWLGGKPEHLKGYNDRDGDGNKSINSLCWEFINTTFPKQVSSMNIYLKTKAVAHFLSSKGIAGKPGKTMHIPNWFAGAPRSPELLANGRPGKTYKQLWCSLRARRTNFCVFSGPPGYGLSWLPNPKAGQTSS